MTQLSLVQKQPLILIVDIPVSIVIHVPHSRIVVKAILWFLINLAILAKVPTLEVLNTVVTLQNNKDNIKYGGDDG
jgi:hypothetical protein